MMMLSLASLDNTFSFLLDYLYGALMLITGILFIVDFKVPKVQSKGLAALGVLVIVELIQIVVTK